MSHSLPPLRCPHRAVPASPSFPHVSLSLQLQQMTRTSSFLMLAQAPTPKPTLPLPPLWAWVYWMTSNAPLPPLDAIHAENRTTL